MEKCMNRNLYHYFLKDIFKLISLLSSRGSVCLFSHVKKKLLTSFEFYFVS